MKLVFSFCGLYLLIGAVGLPSIDMSSLFFREYTKTIKKEYPITSDGKTSISNKYGKVDIKTWDQDRVKIAVEIVVNASSEANAQEVFDRIDVAFANGKDFVKAETSIESVKSRWFTWNTGNNKSDYQINYEVYMPRTNDLDVVHKYGDLSLSAIDGQVNLDVKYVNFKAEELGDDSSVAFSYGSGAINRARNMRLDVGYGKLVLDEAKDLSLVSKYSELSVGKAADVHCETKYDNYNFGEIGDLHNVGKYDNFNIGKANSIDVESKYTQVSAGEVLRNIELNLEYGGASFTLADSFDACALKGRYTDFSVVVARGSSYKIDASTTYAGIRYPRELNVQYEKEQTSSHELKGSVGSGESEILARLSYGSLKVRTQ